MSVIHKSIRCFCLLAIMAGWGASTALADHQDGLGMKGQRQVAVCSFHCTSSTVPSCVAAVCNRGKNFGEACAEHSDCQPGCQGVSVSWYGSEGQFLEATGPHDLDPLEIIEVSYSGTEIFLWCDREVTDGSIGEPVITLRDRNSGVVEAMSNDG